MTAEEHAYTDALEDALERIAMPRRPDGTYNLSREACEHIAREALDKAAWLNPSA